MESSSNRLEIAKNVLARPDQSLTTANLVLHPDWDQSLFEDGGKVAGHTYCRRGLDREAAVADGCSPARYSAF